MRYSLFCLIALGALTTVVEGRRTSSALAATRVWLDAHNCYPEDGHGLDRLPRALAAARGPVAIEQDVAWDAGRNTPVLSHDAALDGTEPTLDEYFFARVAPQLDRALAEHDVANWPVMVLHLDFKTNETAHHAAVWALLGRYERWLTTVEKGADPSVVEPLTPGPLLVLTEHGEGQEADFFERVPVGQRLRIFGTVPSPPSPAGLTPEEQGARAATASPAALIPSGPTNYRRWTNFPWAVVERGGQPHADAWTAEDRARLEALVGRAHQLGLWIRFYTLNGHAPNDEGWSAGYNFGALDAVMPRWRAAAEAGVDFIATDQYEALAEVLKSRP